MLKRHTQNCERCTLRRRTNTINYLRSACCCTATTLKNPHLGPQVWAAGGSRHHREKDRLISTTSNYLSASEKETIRFRDTARAAAPGPRGAVVAPGPAGGMHSSGPTRHRSTRCLLAPLEAPGLRQELQDTQQASKAEQGPTEVSAAARCQAQLNSDFSMHWKKVTVAKFEMKPTFRSSAGSTGGSTSAHLH